MTKDVYQLGYEHKWIRQGEDWKRKAPVHAVPDGVFSGAGAKGLCGGRVEWISEERQWPPRSQRCPECEELVRQGFRPTGPGMTVRPRPD